LLTEETRIAERTTSTAIAAFIRTVERLANQHLATTTTAFRLLIQFKCMPTSHEVKLAWQGDAPGDLLRALVQALEEKDRLPVGEDDVSFQIEMLVSPASQNPTAGPTGAQ